MIRNLSALHWKILLLKGWLIAGLCTTFADRTPIESVESWDGCWSFDGFNDGINIGMGNSIEFLGGFTVDLRFRYAQRQPYSELFHFKLGGTVMSAYLLPGTYDLAVDFRGPDNLFYRHQFPFPGISDKWHHLTICLNQFSPAKAYLDGKTVQAETEIEPMISEIPTNHFHLGGSGDVENTRFAGDIDAVRFWNRMLNEGELEHIGNRNHQSTQSQLLVSWTFKDQDLSPVAAQFQVETKGNPSWSPGDVVTDEEVVIHGRITDGQGIPLPRQIVEIRSPGKNYGQMITDSVGEFFKLIRNDPKEIMVAAYSQDAWIFSETFGISRSSPLQLDFSMSLMNAPVLEGFVRAKDQETPITGAGIEIESLDHPETIGRIMTFSDLSGRFQFSGLPSGNYRVTPQPTNWNLFTSQNGFVEDEDLGETLKIEDTNSGVNFNLNPHKTGKWKHFGMEDSLPSNHFAFIEFSPDHALWTGNETQLYHFYGSGFQRVPLDLSSNEKITDIEVTDITECLIALNTGRLLKVNPYGIILESIGPGRAPIHSILNDNGKIYAATSKGIYWIKLSTLKSEKPTQPSWTMLSKTTAHHLSSHQDGGLWASTTQGIVLIEDELEKKFQKSSGLENAFVSATVQAKDSDTLYAVTSHDIYKKTGDFFEVIKLPHRFEFNFIKCLLASNKGDLWIGTEKDGLWKMSGNTWTQYTMTDGLPSNSVMKVTCDNSGNIWVGTLNGLSRLDENQWLNLGSQFGMPKTQVFSLSYDPETESIYAGTEWAGIVQLYANGLSRHTKPELARNQIKQNGKPLVILGNHLAIASSDSNSFNEVLNNLPYSSWLLTGDIDPSGNLWLGRQWSGGGLMKMNWSYPEMEMPKFEKLWTVEEGLGHPNIWSIWAESEERIWVGTEKGIFIKTGDTWTPVEHKNPDLEYQAMFILPTSSGEIWIGTNRGVGKIVNGRFEPYQTGTLLDETLVWTMHEDSLGKIRVGTNAYGLYVIQNGMINHLTTRSGLSGNSIYDIIEQPEGVLWFANEYGIDRHIPSTAPFKAHFYRIRGDQIYDPSELLPDFKIQSRIVFDVQTSNISLIEQRHKYRVKITHTEENETQVKTLSFNADRLEWVPQKSGHYEFELTAFDKNLFPSQSDTLELNVFPPWYRNSTILIPLIIGGTSALIWIAVLLVKSIQNRKETRILREKLLEQEIKARQHLESVNENLQLARREAINSKQEAEKSNDAKSLFLAKMSHEIRTPLNAVLGYSQMLKSKEFLDEQTLTGLIAIENSGQHLLEIINDILTLSKIESGHIKIQSYDFALHELIDSISEMVTLQCKKKGLEWKIQCSEWWYNEVSGKYEIKELAIKSPWPRLAFHSDIAKLRQILLNLLTNAVKFTHEGSISLEIRIQHPEATNGMDLPQTNQRAPLEVFFSVTDTGTGMEQDDIQRVFHAFEQGRSQGSGEQAGIGLGLSIANRLVEVLGGKLNCQSKPNKGSQFRFTLSLPQARYRSLTKPISTSKPEWRTQPPVALIVDDLEQNSAVLVRLLNLLEIPSTWVQSGKEAIEYLERKKADIIFMDIMMPKMTGIEAFQRIRKMLGPDAPKCVAYSAHVFEHEKEIYDQAMFDATLAKPIELDELINLIQKLFSDRIHSNNVRAENEELKGLKKLNPQAKQRLVNAAERYAVSELMRDLDSLQSSGALPKETCQWLRSMSRSGNMNKMIRALGNHLE